MAATFQPTFVSRPTKAVVSDRLFGAMAGTAHVLVVIDRVPGAEAHADALLDWAQQRIDQLERRWSRFLPDSEVSALNRAEGVALRVSSDTLDLVTRCVHGWRATAGLFDPSVHDLMVHLGDDGHLDNLLGGRVDPATLLPAVEDIEHAQPFGPPAPGCADIEIDRNAATVCLGAGVALDPGGIGKGLAADLVVEQLLGAGAAGAMVSLGDDTVVGGRPPTSDGWHLAVADPRTTVGAGGMCAAVGLSVGAVATSSRSARRWRQAGRLQHHLLDAAGGHPAWSDLESVTVLASAGWWAEALSTAAFVGGAQVARELMHLTGATGLMVHGNGAVEHFDGLSAYLR